MDYQSNIDDPSVGGQCQGAPVTPKFRSRQISFWVHLRTLGFGYFTYLLFMLPYA